MIVDLKTTDIESQVSLLLETQELETDEALCTFLEAKLLSMRREKDEVQHYGFSKVNLLETPLVQSLSLE